jgi:hypothetical protein
MSHPPCLAIVIEGGLVQRILLQDWPAQMPSPRIVVVDYDIDGADEDALSHFSIGDTPEAALCHREIPERCEDCQAALSPRELWTMLDPPDRRAGAGEKRPPTPIEQSLTEHLTGYLRHAPARREALRHFPGWPDMARREVDRRTARFLEVLPDDLLQAIARGEVDLARLAREIPD